MALNGLHMILDRNGNPIPILPLKDSHDVDGTSASAQSNAITGPVARIVSLDNILRIKTGENPTAGASDIAIPALDTLWIPLVPGHKIAVKGGKANISTAGW